MIDMMQASFAFSIYGKPTIDHWYNGHGGTKIGACHYISIFIVWLSHHFEGPNNNHNHRSI